MSDYPKFLYRHNPDAERIDGVHCDLMAVNDEAEEKAAVGWHDTVAAAAPKPKKPA